MTAERIARLRNWYENPNLPNPAWHKDILALCDDYETQAAALAARTRDVAIERERYETLAAAALKTIKGVIEETRTFDETCDCAMCEGIRETRRLLGDTP